MKTIREFVEYLAKVKNESNGESIPIFAYDGRAQIAKAALAYKTVFSEKGPDGEYVPVGGNSNTILFITPAITTQFRNSPFGNRLTVED